MQNVALELFVLQVLNYSLISIILPAHDIISFIHVFFYPFNFDLLLIPLSSTLHDFSN
jgi:hypothetical protein